VAARVLEGVWRGAGRSWEEVAWVGGSAGAGIRKRKKRMSVW